MYIESPYIMSLERIATSTTTFTLRTPPLQKGDTFILDSLCVSISGHKPKTVDVGFLVGNTPIWLETLKITDNNRFFTTSVSVHVPSSYRIYVRFNSPTVDVVYKVNVFGRLWHYCKVGGENDKSS